MVPWTYYVISEESLSDGELLQTNNTLKVLFLLLLAKNPMPIQSIQAIQITNIAQSCNKYYN